MFRTRKERAAAVTARPSARTPDPACTGFRFAVSTTEYPFMHPVHPGFYAYFSFRNGGEITVATPFYAAADSPRFRLPDLPFDQWTQLTDDHGRPIPLAVHVDSLGAEGRWL